MRKHGGCRSDSGYSLVCTNKGESVYESNKTFEAHSAPDGYHYGAFGAYGLSGDACICGKAARSGI